LRVLHDANQWPNCLHKILAFSFGFFMASKFTKIQPNLNNCPKEPYGEWSKRKSDFIFLYELWRRVELY